MAVDDEADGGENVTLTQFITFIEPRVASALVTLPWRTDKATSLPRKLTSFPQKRKTAPSVDTNDTTLWSLTVMTTSPMVFPLL